ncbi:MAG: O-antigen ligase family protein [Smithellaceae bacterium]|jgi:O-antigen ligase
MLKIFSTIINGEGDKTEIFFRLLDYLIPLFMAIYIFLNPLPMAAVSEFCFYLSLLVLIILLVFRKTNFTLRLPLTLPLVLFFLWAVFGLFFTLDFKNTLHDLRGHLLEYLIIFYLLVNYFHSQKRLEILSVIVIAGATVFSFGAVISYYFIDGNSFSTRLGLTFKEMHTDYIGFITIFAITLAFNRLQNSKVMANTLLFLLCIVVLFISTLLTQSRGTLIGLFTSLIILCFSNKKIIIVAIAVLILAFFLPGLKDRFDHEKIIHNERVKMNRLTLEVIKKYPIVGIGFGMQIYGNPNLVDLEKLNSQLPAQYQQERIVTSPHNTVLDITVRTGIVGLVLFLNILLTSFFMLWKILRLTKSEYFKSWAICLFACFASFMIQAMVADTTFGSRIVVFYTILAMITILWNLVQKEKNENVITS